MDMDSCHSCYTSLKSAAHAHRWCVVMYKQTGKLMSTRTLAHCLMRTFISQGSKQIQLTQKPDDLPFIQAKVGIL